MYQYNADALLRFHNNCVPTCTTERRLSLATTGHFRRFISGIISGKTTKSSFDVYSWNMDNCGGQLLSIGGRVPKSQWQLHSAGVFHVGDFSCQFSSVYWNHHSAVYASSIDISGLHLVKRENVPVGKVHQYFILKLKPKIFLSFHFDRQFNVATPQRNKKHLFKIFLISKI